MKRLYAPQAMAKWMLASRIAAVLALGLAFSGLLARITGYDGHGHPLLMALTQFRATTAMCIGALGLAILLRSRVSASAGARIVALIALLLSSATLVQYATGCDLGFDQWITPGKADLERTHPGRMAPSTSLSVALAAASLVLGRRGWTFWSERPLRRVRVALATASVLAPYLSSLVLLRDPHGNGQFLLDAGTVSLGASTALLLAGIGLLCQLAHEDALSGGETPIAGAVGRRFLVGLLLTSALFPALMAWIRVAADAVGIFHPNAWALWIVAVAVTVFLSAGVVAARRISVYESRWLEIQHDLEARVRDRTIELEASADALRGSRYQLSAILDSVNAAVVTVNEQLEIVLFNKAAELTFQRGAAEMLGGPVDVLMPERFREGHHGLITAFRDRGETVAPHGVERLLPGLRANGEEFPMQAAVASLEVSGKKLMTIILKDMSHVVELQREQRARIQAETANVAKSKFLSHLSHELRTPLNAVIGFAQLLEDKDVASRTDTVLRYAERIKTSGLHQLTMVNDLLDLTRVELGHAPLVLMPVAVQPIVETAAKMLEHQAAAARVTLDGIDTIPPDAVAHADAGRLRQVVTNILSNAIKYNQSPGHVEIRVTPHGQDDLAIAIADTGIGMSEAQLSELYVPFNRLGKEGTHTEGFGIGLSLARNLVEAMHGRIEVSSEVDVGTTFVIHMPRAHPDRHEPAAPAPQTRPA
jgi:PAS domain S-box-containing protein